MLIKEPALQECRNVDCGALTNHTLEVLTRGGTMISFPCCVRCSGTLRVRLSHAKEDMDLEESIPGLKKLVKSEATNVYYKDTARKESYVEVKSVKAKEIERRNPTPTLTVDPNTLAMMISLMKMEVV